MLNVKTREQAKVFLLWCSQEIGGVFHPDDDFEDYVKDGEPMFSIEKAQDLNFAMEQCFKVMGDYVYEYTLKLQS